MDLAKFHRTLFGSEPTDTQLSFYETFNDGKRGFDNPERNQGRLLAVMVAALALTDQKHRVIISCPADALTETETDVKEFARLAFRKLKGKKAAVKAVLVAMRLIGIIPLTNLPVEPTGRWLCHRHSSKDKNTPKWMKAVLHE